MSKVTVIKGDEETHLYRTELEHLSGNIYTTRVGLLSLRKLDYDIYYEEAEENKAEKNYWLIQMTPTTKRLINNDDLFQGRALTHLNMKVVIFLKQIPRAGNNIPLLKHKFKFLGCMLIRNGEVIDSHEIIFGDKL